MQPRPCPWSCFWKKNWNCLSELLYPGKVKHSNNPLFWYKWQENLNNLAKVELDPLLDETKINITQFKLTFYNQKIELYTTLNNDSTYAKLSAHMENMAFKLLLFNLNQLRAKKLKNILHNNTSNLVPRVS